MLITSKYQTSDPWANNFLLDKPGAQQEYFRLLDSINCELKDSEKTANDQRIESEEDRYTECYLSVFHFKGKTKFVVALKELELPFTDHELMRLANRIYLAVHEFSCTEETNNLYWNIVEEVKESKGKLDLLTEMFNTEDYFLEQMEKTFKSHPVDDVIAAINLDKGVKGKVEPMTTEMLRYWWDIWSTGCLTDEEYQNLPMVKWLKEADAEIAARREAKKASLLTDSD